MIRGCLGLFKMPSYYTVRTQDQDYDFYVEPVGIRKYLRFWPYLSGGFLTFNLFAYDKYSKGVSLKYEWRLLRLHDKEYYEYDNKIGGDHFYTWAFGLNSTFWSQLVIPAVSASGEYKMELKVSNDSEVILDWAAIADFKQQSRDDVYFRLLLAGIGFLGLIIGGIIGWVLK